MFLAQQARGRLREKRGKERYVQLADRAVREMKSYLDHPTEDCKKQLRSLLLEIEAEQNEYVSIQWSAVRNIKSWDLLIVENTLRSILTSGGSSTLALSGCTGLCGWLHRVREEINPTDRGHRPILATVFHGQEVRGILDSGTSITKDESHDHPR